MKKIKRKRLERKRPACNEHRFDAKTAVERKRPCRQPFVRAVRSLQAGRLRSSLLAILVIGAFFGFACNYNSFEKPNVNAPAVNGENKQSALESDLQTLKTANLKYIFVFRRKDGAAFDGEDKKYLRTNLPTTNRVVSSEEGKAFVVGSNYKFPPENTEVLQLRFNIEDFSVKE